MKRYFAGLLLIYFVLVSIYTLNTPLFEAPDEYYHFAVIEHITRTGKRPPTADAQNYPWRQMAFHAPLYHFIGAVLVRPINTDDFLSHYPLNPHAQIGEPSAEDNVNFVAHTGDPWRDTGLAVRVLRGLSIVLGAVTLTGTYALARCVFPKRQGVALLAVAAVLFNPQFLFVSGVINNDNLVVALSTLALAWLVYIIRGESPPTPDPFPHQERRGENHSCLTSAGMPLPFRGQMTQIVVLAGLAAGASLAKASGLTIYVPIVLGVLWVCYRDRLPLRHVLAYAAVGLAVFALVAGWWYTENWGLYGDPSASTMVAEVTGLRGDPVDVPGELRGLYYSFWGLFGWFNIPAPEIFYQYTALLLFAAAIGVMRQTRKILLRSFGDNFVIAAVLAVYAVTVIASWWRFNTLVLAGQGRLWFPLLSVLGCTVGWGLAVLLEGTTPFIRQAYPVVFLFPLVVAAVGFPFALLQPAYGVGRQVSATMWQPPKYAVPVPFREPWQENACIVLWVTPVAWDGVTSSVGFDVAWEARCQMTGYWSVFVHFSDIERETCEVGDTRHVLTQRDTMPDRGNTPFPAIKPGFVLNDHVVVPVLADLDRSREWHLQMGLYDAGGTFIRAFVVPEVGSTLLTNEMIFIGRCSPELVNLRLE